MFSNPKKVVDGLGITPGMTIADVGAGSGEYAVALAKHVGQSGRVYAIDVQKDLLTKVKNASLKGGVGNIDIVWGDVEKEGGAGLSDNVADMTMLANVLFQFEDKKSAVSEVVRITKPKGKIVVIDWKDSFGGLGPRTEDVVTPEQAHALFKEFDFKKVSEFNAGDHHYGIILQKEL